MNATGVAPGASAPTLTVTVATIELPMIGASRSLINGNCCSNEITGAANKPTSGMLTRNLSKLVTSVIRTPNCSVPLPAPVIRFRQRDRHRPQIEFAAVAASQ